MDALTKVRNWKNMPKTIDMLVVRINRLGELSESRPCLHCILFIERSGINVKNVYYSTRDRIIVKENFKNMKNSPLTYTSSGIRNGVGKKIFKVSK